MKEFPLQTVLWFRFIYVASVLPLTILLAFLPLPRIFLAASKRTFDISYLSIFILSRILIFILVFFVFHIGPRGDVVGYYYPEASRTLHGAFVYRDFASSYAPLFSYIGATVLRMSNTPLALIAFTIFVEVCSIPIWFAAIRPSCSETAFRHGALLYLVQPLMIFDVAVDGGNNVWVAFCLALALLYFSRRRDAASGASYAASVVAVKFLPLIFAPWLLLSARRRLAWTIGFLVPVVSVYGLFALRHANIFLPLQQEGNSQLGGSLPLLFSYIMGIEIPGRISDGITVLALLACAFVCWRMSHRPQPSEHIRENARTWITSTGLLVLTLCMLTFSKKSWTIYIIMVMFILCQLAARSGRFTRLVYCVYSFLLIVEPSFLFARVGNRHQPIHALLAQSDPSAILLLIMYIVELFCSAWFIYVSVRDVHPAMMDQAAA